MQHSITQRNTRQHKAWQGKARQETRQQKSKTTHHTTQHNTTQHNTQVHSSCTRHSGGGERCCRFGLCFLAYIYICRSVLDILGQSECRYIRPIRKRMVGLCANLEVCEQSPAGCGVYFSTQPRRLACKAYQPNPAARRCGN